MRFQIFRYKNVNSTNLTAIRIIKNSNCKNGMVISDLQKSGKGQYGKKWISIKGNLFVSFFYNLENLELSLRKLTLFNCILVKKLLSKYYKKRIHYKKPNDLLIHKKKICGILQETINKLNEKYMIVGIGINLNKSPLIKNYPTTNLYDLTQKKIKKKDIEKKLKDVFEQNLSKFYFLQKRN
tara:strand:+ start:1005 stop:1550 length:546 start_codon:yes stop_codon:yes gene_type:complete